jgi:hypothetical protein
MSSVMDRLGNVVERLEIAPFMLDFSRPEERREYLFLDGQPMRSDLAYMEIYGKTKRSIHIQDTASSVRCGQQHKDNDNIRQPQGTDA